MNSKQPYSAFLIQYVQDAGSQERLSVGVALECAGREFVGCRVLRSVTRITQAFPGTDTHALKRALASLQAAIEGRPVGELQDGLAKTVPSIFDSGLVLGHEIRGITSDPEASMNALFARFAPPTIEKDGRDEDDVWKDFERRLAGRRIPMIEVEAQGRLPHTFKHVWKNGVRNAVETLSLDRAGDPRKRAAQNAGLYRTLAAENQSLKISLLVGTPDVDAENHAAAQIGIEILQRDLGESVEVVPESQAGELAARIVAQAHDFD